MQHLRGVKSSTSPGLRRTTWWAKDHRPSASDNAALHSLFSLWTSTDNFRSTGGQPLESFCLVTTPPPSSPVRWQSIPQLTSARSPASRSSLTPYRSAPGPDPEALCPLCSSCASDSSTTSLARPPSPSRHRSFHSQTMAPRTPSASHDPLAAYHLVRARRNLLFDLEERWQRSVRSCVTYVFISIPSARAHEGRADVVPTSKRPSNRNRLHRSVAERNEQRGDRCASKVP